MIAMRKRFETTDKALLRRVFERHAAESLYLWADLSEPFFSQCRWWISVADDEPESVVIVFTGLSEPSVQSAGPAAGVEALLCEFAGDLPETAWFKAPVEHADAWRRWFALESEEDLFAMVLPRTRQVAPALATVKRWSPSDELSPLLRIYEDYPGNFFEASGLEGNVYLSVLDADTQEHVCVAGTHAISIEERVAVLGNIATKASYRNRGYARRCVAALAGELRRMGCETVGLHVAAENTAAIRCYEGLGFEVEARLRQARARKSR